MSSRDITRAKLARGEPAFTGVMVPDGATPPWLESSIQHALASMIPDDKHGVVLQVQGSSGQGVAIAIAARLEHGWTIEGLASWDRYGVEGQVTVVKTW